MVDLKTMRAERTESNRQGFKGSADLAFTLKIKNSNNKAKLFVGLVLEHKSYPDNEVVSQLEHYFYELFHLSRPDCPMVAVIVYNGEIKWNPFKAKLYAKYPEYFHDAKNKIDDSFIQEVLLYLGEESSSEYREAIMDRPEIMAERKRNGFVSVADVIRAEGREEGLAKGEASGLEKGEEIGLAKGFAKLVQSAKNFLAMGLSVEQVSKGTGLSIAEIQKHCL